MERVDADVIPFAQNNPSGYRFAFGTDNATDDINENYNDNIKKGWGTTPNEFPEIEDFNAMAYTTGYLLSYLYQMGIAEWNDKQEYRQYSRVIGSDGKIYKSKTGTDLAPNVDNNPVSDTTNWEYEAAYSSETARGIIELATTVEAQDGVDDLRAVTPLKLFNSLKGSNQSLSANGYQKLHGGLIIQWGEAVNNNSLGSGLNTLVFPIAFPNQCFSIAKMSITTGASGYDDSDSSFVDGAISATGATWIAYDYASVISTTPGVIGFTYIAIGY